ncbi:hypothetical protein B7R87_17930 [Streptomyces tsukubensis]|nr:hypothetical protein B7R87_17930 [Streptomyces tsukubensis]
MSDGLVQRPLKFCGVHVALLPHSVSPSTARFRGVGHPSPERSPGQVPRLRTAPGGSLLVRCNNRRTTRCAACAEVYRKADPARDPDRRRRHGRHLRHRPVAVVTRESTVTQLDTQQCQRALTDSVRAL